MPKLKKRRNAASSQTIKIIEVVIIIIFIIIIVTIIIIIVAISKYQEKVVSYLVTLQVAKVRGLQRNCPKNGLFLG